MGLEKVLNARKIEISLECEVIQDFRFIIQCCGNGKSNSRDRKEMTAGGEGGGGKR